MYGHYLGVNLHKRRTYLVLMDAHDQVNDQCRLGNAAVAAYAAQLPPSTFAVLEATGNWSYMYDVLSRHVERVVLAQPKQVRAIAAAKVKTDKIDATILAHVARADLLPTAYAPAAEIRELRETARHRAKLVRKRTRHKKPDPSAVIGVQPAAAPQRPVRQARTVTSQPLLYHDQLCKCCQATARLRQDENWSTADERRLPFHKRKLLDPPDRTPFGCDFPPPLAPIELSVAGRRDRVIVRKRCHLRRTS